jgi:hypothetical protein
MEGPSYFVEPITLTAARKWLANVHRHLKRPVTGWLFGVRVVREDTDTVVGVANGRTTDSKAPSGRLHRRNNPRRDARRQPKRLFFRLWGASEGCRSSRLHQDLYLHARRRARYLSEGRGLRSGRSYERS